MRIVRLFFLIVAVVIAGHLDRVKGFQRVVEMYLDNLCGPDITGTPVVDLLAGLVFGRGRRILL